MEGCPYSCSWLPLMDVDKYHIWGLELSMVVYTDSSSTQKVKQKDHSELCIGG